MNDQITYRIIGAAIEVHKDLPAIASSGEAGWAGMWIGLEIYDWFKRRNQKSIQELPDTIQQILLIMSNKKVLQSMHECPPTLNAVGKKILDK